MKRILLALLIIVLLGLVSYYGFFTTSKETFQIQTKHVEKEVIVSETENRIKEAQEAVKADIEAKAQAAYDDMYKLQMDKIRAEVLAEVEAEIRNKRIEVEKEIGVY